MSFSGCLQSRRFKNVCVFLGFFATILVCDSFETFAHSGGSQLHYNQAVIDSLDREIAQCSDERYLAVLRGLRWCVAFCDDDSKFDFTFSNYVVMLDELTLHRSRPALASIVHTLIVREFERALPRFSTIFSPDAEGYEEFISILPIAYRHQVPAKPLKEFASHHFGAVTPFDRLHEFRQAAKKRDYDRLTDLVVWAAFLNMAYRWQVDEGLHSATRQLPDHYDRMCVYPVRGSFQPGCLPRSELLCHTRAARAKPLRATPSACLGHRRQGLFLSRRQLQYGSLSCRRSRPAV